MLKNACTCLKKFPPKYSNQHDNFTSASQNSFASIDKEHMHLNLSKTILLCAVALSITVGLAACGGGETPISVTPVAIPVGTTGGVAGKLLYNSYCLQCHGLGSKSASAVSANTMGAISSNRGGMGGFSGIMTQADVDNMALYLANPAAF
jgi:mono/diheme cytochrome c family protein